MLEQLNNQFTELEPLHRKHNELLKYISDFCEENEVEWCLAFGSALGAKRHGGPIPWDDDVDIYMPAGEYKKFRKLFNEKGDKQRFYLQELGSIPPYTGAVKLRMNGTAVIEECYRDKDMHQGIYVDIFLLHEAPPTKLAKMQAIVSNYYLTLKSLSNRGYNRRKLFIPLLAFLRLFPRNFGRKAAMQQQEKWDYLNGDVYADWELRTGNPKWFIPKNYLFPAVSMQYDDLEVKVPREIEKYLEICYGQWEQLPHIDKILWAQHASKWSVTEDFRKFAPNIKDFSDERA